jgi:hypothetical protein
MAGVAVVANRKSAAQPPKRVALIGDSYAEGLGWELAKIFPDFRFEGHVGTNTSQWANHTGCGTCGDWLTEYRPDVVLVSLGVNDGSTPKASNYQTIVRALQGIGARVVWIEPPAAVSTQSRYTIATLGVPVVPGTRAPLAADSLHPTSYASWAQEIAGVLRDA